MEQNESKNSKKASSNAISFVDGSKFGVVDIDEADEDI